MTSDDTTPQLILYKVVFCFVNPVLAVTGFGANMLSIAILRHSGLNRPSNILLLALVVADSMSQMLIMNYGLIIELFGPDMEFPVQCGWQYDIEINYFLLVSHIMFFFFGTWGQYVSSSIPVIITLERFLAVYMPITFKSVVTVKTSILCATFVFIFWLPWVVFYLGLFQASTQSSKIMLFSRTASLLSDETIFTLFYYYICDNLSSWFPESLVIVGCVIIGIKVKITLSQRRQLTSSMRPVKWSSKTTKTLLATCAVFSMTRSTGSICNYLISENDPLTYYIKKTFIDLLFLINSSSNLFVYVISDNKLLVIFKCILHLNKSQNNSN
ncbi:hypothetical protein Btru_072105 [Bulinus truncatus]|nr:hypothetical protein Btru_072105 [Bulinus truncatus]